MKRFLITLILMLSVFSIVSAHPFKSEKELYNYYAEIDKKINEELKTLKSNGKYDELINKYGLKVKK